MRIACSRCHAAYEVPDEKLSRAAVKIRCSQCSHLFVARRRVVEQSLSSAGELSFDDFDFGGLAAKEPAPEPPPRRSTTWDEAPEEPPSFSPARDSTRSSADRSEPSAAEDELLPDLDSLNFDDLEIPALGELDLGDFDVPEEHDSPPAAAEAKPRGEREPLERVREEELVSPPPVLKEVPLQGIADDIPRLDLQKGPRRVEGAAARSPLMARDGRRSPLFWVVLVAAVAAAGYTGYNVVRRPEAFTFLNPTRLLEYWRERRLEAKLGLEALKGYYRDFPGGRRVFVIRGEVANRSDKAQGVIRVKGALFGADGSRLAAREVFCGNVLNDRELATLPRETIEARLQNQVGEALSNVDIAPGSKVPFMVVFTPPPEGVEKFDVTVSAFKGQ